MDLGYLRAHPTHLTAFLTHQRIRETPVPGGYTSTARRLTLEDGHSIFAKSMADPPAGFFATEAAGLRWLRSAEAVPVPEVIVEQPDLLALEWIDTGPATPRAAEHLGRGLAALHAAGAPSFGAAWPGYIGSLPLDNTPSPGPWPEWFATRRLEPYLRRSVANGALDTSDATLVEDVLNRITDLAGASGAEPPARIHGDLWPGNVLWSAAAWGGARPDGGAGPDGGVGPDGAAWLVDPAAHGGHRETDLACLALFGGLPHLDRVLAAYTEASPLAEGWPERVPLHQLHLLLVHTALFGGRYREPMLDAARRCR
ncbi:MAG TPA: fructosamine kinase family protein [Micromonosporaceae bacterium]|nr:fructosamine kinase family protein [Micromonosporaceae bacterium]